MPSVKEIYQFDELTWPEVNEAVEMGKIPIIPTEAARLKAEFALVLPPVSYGYVHHVMDFPGSINIHHEHFIQYVLGITKSLAYHGFKKMIILNGHGSNHSLVDMVARRTIVETDASCTFTSWWQLLKVNPGFDEKWRESVFPGGCSHAGELETSMLMYLSPESVREDKIKSEIAKTNKRGSKYIWGDLFGKSAMGLVEWTSQYSDSGVMGEAEKATAEKGEIVFEEASKNLAEFIEEYHGMEIAERTSHHAQEPTFPLSFPTD